MVFDPNLLKDQVITNREMMDIFKCGMMGGMRRSRATNTLVIISDHTKNLYRDKWIGDVLHYTGMGKVGDQEINFGQNGALASYHKNDVDVHLFEVEKKGEYIYRGRVELAGVPYEDKQLDVNGNNRRVWIFPLKIKQ